MKILQASLVAALLFVNAGAADEKMTVEEKFALYDKDKDGKITSMEYHEKTMEKFTRYDKDKNGSLSKEEYTVMYEDKKDQDKHQGK